VKASVPRTFAMVILVSAITLGAIRLVRSSFGGGDDSSTPTPSDSRTQNAEEQTPFGTPPAPATSPFPEPVTSPSPAPTTSPSPTSENSNVPALW